MDVTLQPSLPGSGQQPENWQFAEGLQKLARAASSLHTSASTVIVGDRSTVWGASVLGERLSQGSSRDIIDWIPPPIEEEPDEGEAQNLLPVRSADYITAQSIRSRPTEDRHTLQAYPDYDSDPENEFIAKLETQGLQALAQGNYEEAIKWLTKAMTSKRRKVSSNNTIEHLKAGLATAHCYMGHWGKAYKIVHSLHDNRNKLDALALHRMHSISMAFLAQNKRLEHAIQLGRKVLKGMKKLFGDGNDPYFFAIELMSQLYIAKGNLLDSNGWHLFLPDGWVFGRSKNAQQYLP